MWLNHLVSCHYLSQSRLLWANRRRVYCDIQSILYSLFITNSAGRAQEKEKLKEVPFYRQRTPGFLRHDDCDPGSLQHIASIPPLSTVYDPTITYFLWPNPDAYMHTSQQLYKNPISLSPRLAQTPFPSQAQFPFVNPSYPLPTNLKET